MGHRLGLGGIDRLVALHLVRDRIGRAQVLLDQSEHLLLERGVVRHLVSSRGSFAAFSASLMMASITGWKCRWPNITAPSITSSDSSLASDSTISTASCGAGDDEVELALRHLLERRVEHVFVVDEADARRADRAHEGRAREGQRRRGRDHRQHVGIVLEVVRQRRHDHLGLVAPAVGEQRPDRAVDQPRDQRLFLGRAAFALEIAAGNAARGVELLLVVDGERQEVDAFSRLLGGDHGRQHLGLAIGGDDGAVGLAGDLAGL